MDFDSSFLRKLERLELLIRRTSTQHLTGRRSGKQLGGGLEFSSYRQYQPGDDYRYIDWNLYSRLSQLFLKQFIDERNTLIYFLIDCSQSMDFGTPTKFELAVKLAGALGYIALTSEDQVGITSFSGENTADMRPVKGRGQIQRLFQTLDQLSPEGETRFQSSIRSFCHQQQRPGLAVIISDLLIKEDFHPPLKELRGRGWNILLLQILSEEEITPEIDGPQLLVDSEDGEMREIGSGREAVSLYRKNREDYLDAVSKFCRKYTIHHMLISTAQSLDELLFDRLHDRRIGLLSRT